MKIRRGLIIAAIILISGFDAMGKEISVENAVKMFLEKGSYRKSEQADKEAFQARKEYNFFRRWADLRLELQPQYMYYKNKEENGLYWANFNIETENSPIQNYTGTINTVLSYKSFYLHTFFDHNASIQRNRGYGSFEIGINQNVNDLFYNENDYRENMVVIDEKQNKNNLESKKSAEIDSIVELYVKIENLEIEASHRENIKRENEAVLKNYRERLALGEGVQLDIDYMEIEAERSEEETLLLREQIECEKKNLLAKIGEEEGGGITLKKIDYVEAADINVKEFELRGKEIEIEREKESMKYDERQNRPIMIFQGTYDIEYGRWRAGLYFNMNLGYYVGEAEIRAKTVKRLEAEKEEIRRKILQEKEKKEQEYEKIRKNLQIAKKLEGYWKKKYDVDEKMVKKGYIGLVDFLKTRNKYSEALMSTQRIENELGGFLYKNNFYMH